MSTTAAETADHDTDRAARLLDALGIADDPFPGTTSPPKAAASPLDDTGNSQQPLQSLLDFSDPFNGTRPKGGDDVHQVSTATRESESLSRSNGASGGIRANLQESTASLEGECNLIVAGLTRDIDDAALRTMFSRFGTVMSSTVMRHVGTGASRGFGFVLFARHSEGEAAIAAMHGSKCGPNTLNVHKSHHDGTVVETNAVFVRNLPLDVTVARIHAFFAPVVAPVSIEIAADTSRDAGDAPTGRRYKVATVAFADIPSARNVVRNLHNKPFPATQPGDEAPLVIVKFAESVHRRRERQAARKSTSTSTLQRSTPSLPGSLTSNPFAAPGGLAEISVGSHHGQQPNQMLHAAAPQPMLQPGLMYVAGPNGQPVPVASVGQPMPGSTYAPMMMPSYAAHQQFVQPNDAGLAGTASAPMIPFSTHPHQHQQHFQLGQQPSASALQQHFPSPQAAPQQVHGQPQFAQQIPASAPQRANESRSADAPAASYMPMNGQSVNATPPFVLFAPQQHQHHQQHQLQHQPHQLQHQHYVFTGAPAAPET